MTDTQKDKEAPVAVAEEKPKKPKSKPVEISSVVTESTDSDAPKSEDTSADQVLTYDQMRREKLYKEYWKDKVKDPTDTRYPWEYIKDWF